MVYTPMLNERGGFESDLTVVRLAQDRFWLLTGSAQATRDADWIGRHIGAEEFAVLTDVSALTSVISVMAVTVEPSRSGESTATVRSITPASVSARTRRNAVAGEANTFAASAWLDRVASCCSSASKRRSISSIYFLCVSTLEFFITLCKACNF